MSEWIDTTLGEVLNFRRGHDLPKSQMIDGDIPVAGSNGIIGWHHEATNISPCLTIGRSGSVGKPYLYDKAWAHNTVLYIDDFKGNDPRFLYYLIQTLPLAEYQAGSAVPTLNRNHIHPLPIKFPSTLSEQLMIAAILSSLDDKIETNRAINARLEELAAAIFKSWFIDFEPFGGMLPKDWKEVKMLDIITDIAAGPFGSNLPKNCFTDEGTPIIDGANLKGRIVDETFSKFVSQDKAIELKRSVAKRGEFVVTISGTVGQIAYIAGISNNSNYLVSQRQFRFSLDKRKANIYYISLLFANDTGKQKILSFANQVGVPALSQPLKNFKNIDIILPPIEIQNKFGEIIRNIDSQICNNIQEISRLASLRDTLLPRLMSGELIPE